MLVRDFDRSQEYSTTTVAMVTSSYDGIINVMAAEWTIRSSIDPFLISLYVGYERKTYEMVRASGEFGLSYSSSDQAEIVHISGNYSRRSLDKIGTGMFPLLPSNRIKAPLIAGSICNFECRVVDEFPCGDHAIFVGEVLEGYYDDSKSPLVFHGGKFYRLGDRIPKKRTSEY
ncbi:MAG: flavin reductase family protein [Candidatus Thermoplasmatota archaeon]|nr:flavin reductase family protein [Candidatus Thermoplasmatota archaeon]MCL5790729.1 flavin reductase family protein [Candidatus Thermoplasmatota archaeon]